MIVLTPLKILILILFVVVLIALIRGGLAMSGRKNRQDSTDTARALTMRIGFSAVIFLILVAALLLGGLKPNATPGNQAVTTDEPQ